MAGSRVGAAQPTAQAGAQNTPRYSQADVTRSQQPDLHHCVRVQYGTGQKKEQDQKRPLDALDGVERSVMMFSQVGDHPPCTMADRI